MRKVHSYPHNVPINFLIQNLQSDDSDDSDDGFDNDLDEMEKYKLRANSVYNYKLITINQTVQQGNIIALYSQPTAFE